MKYSLVRAGLAAATAVSLVVIAAAASPSGHARGISYGSLNAIQKRLASGGLAVSLAAPAKGAAPSAAAAGSCVNPTGGGEEADEADNECAPDRFATPNGGGGAGNDPNYTATSLSGCSESQGDNIKVNQNCQNISDPDLAGRGQAQNEEAIAIDPNHPERMIASQNDYRRGDGNCYGAYSTDAGKHWTDTTIPMSFTLGGDVFGTPREYWQAGGDTSVAWDTKGNAYFSCQVFNRGSDVSPNGDQSSAFYVFRSTGNGGASWNFPGRPVAELNDIAGEGVALLDKNYMAVDDHVGSPFQDRIYMTWTNFAADGTGYIYESHSSDYGESFSAPVLVSKDSPLCPFTYSGDPFGIPTPQGRCNANQDSLPFVGSDGALYVVWNNYNSATSNPFGTGSDNANQVLLSKSTDGGSTFSAPVRVSSYYDLPDCLTYQTSDPGRGCVPEKGPSTNSVFRANNYPVGSVNPKNPNQVVVTFGSYLNRDSNATNGCTPQGYNRDTLIPLYNGVKTAGSCNNDILVSISNDGGATFSGANTDPQAAPTVNPDPRQALSDQFWQWQAFGDNGKLAVDYYDRQYGKSSPPATGPGAATAAEANARARGGIPFDEYYGYSDITLSGSKDLVNWGTTRVTTSPMPPPTQFGGQFYGDYIGMDAAGGRAFPIWSDTRDPELFTCPAENAADPPMVCTGVYDTDQGPIQANDQNSYTSAQEIPTR